jgi:ribonucleoside-diphosphate reductase alpha chain
MIINVIKRDGTIVPFNFDKIKNAVNKAFNAVYKSDAPSDFIDYLQTISSTFEDDMKVEDIQNFVIYSLGEFKYYDVQIAYIKYKDKHDSIRN